MTRQASQIRVAALVGAIFFLSLGWAQDYSTRFPTLAEKPLKLTQGRWALLFVVVPGCPACEKTIIWFSQAAQAFPKIRFVVVAPKITLELVAFIEAYAPEVGIMYDSKGALGKGLEVERAPTLVFFVEGMPPRRLNWPFSEVDMRRELSKSLEIRILSDLLGEPAPDFVAMDLAGTEVALTHLPRPLLLVFFNPECPPCWEVLPALTELSQEVGVALFTFVGEAGLSPTDRTRLEAFLRERREKPVTVLIVHNSDVLWTYGVTGSPSFILVDGKGVICWVWSGLIKSVDLMTAVRLVLTRQRQK